MENCNLSLPKIDPYLIVQIAALPSWQRAQQVLDGQTMHDVYVLLFSYMRKFHSVQVSKVTDSHLHCLRISN